MHAFLRKNKLGGFKVENHWSTLVSARTTDVLPAKHQFEWSRIALEKCCNWHNAMIDQCVGSDADALVRLKVEMKGD